MHNYDAHTDVNDVRTQREFSLLATFKKVFRTIARLPGLRDDQFALLFEDDIAVHSDVWAQVHARSMLLLLTRAVSGLPLVHAFICGRPHSVPGGIRCGQADVSALRSHSITLCSVWYLLSLSSTHPCIQPRKLAPCDTGLLAGMQRVPGLELRPSVPADCCMQDIGRAHQDFQRH